MSDKQKAPQDEQPKQRGRPVGIKETKPRNVSAETRKQRSENMKKVVEGNYPVSGEGYNTKYIQFMLEVMPTEPLDTNDVAEMERRFVHYLDVCAKYDMKVGNLGAYTAIGITKDQARHFEENVKSNPARSDLIKKVRQFCAMYREGLMGDGKVNPVTGIFWQKNYDGFRDQTEMVVSQGPQNEYKSAEQLSQKYLESSDIGELPVVAEAEGVIEDDPAEQKEQKDTSSE